MFVFRSIPLLSSQLRGDEAVLQAPRVKQVKQTHNFEEIPSVFGGNTNCLYIHHYKLYYKIRLVMT